MQRLADHIGLRLSICHFPPGTSKWNKIEHSMFCHITSNWRGKPRTSHEVVVNLIGNTKTKTGLTIKAALDTGRYPIGIQVSGEDLAQVCLEKAGFHGEWNMLPSGKPRDLLRSLLSDGQTFSSLTGRTSDVLFGSM